MGCAPSDSAATAVDAQLRCRCRLGGDGGPIVPLRRQDEDDGNEEVGRDFADGQGSVGRDFASSLALGKTIEFEANGVDVVARVSSKRAPPEGPMCEFVYQIEYVSGQAGKEWVWLDETRKIVRSQFMDGDVPFAFSKTGKSMCVSRIQEDGPGGEQPAQAVEAPPGAKPAAANAAGSGSVSVVSNDSAPSAVSGLSEERSPSKESSAAYMSEADGTGSAGLRSPRSAASSSSAVSLRSVRRRQRRQLGITETMGTVPSKALQLNINNAGEIAKNYRMESRVLGEGSFGTVKRATVRATGATRAVKAISKKMMKTKVGVLKQEIEIMKLVDHPNLVMLYEIFENATTLFLVMELCTGGHLQGLVERYGRLTEQRAAIAMQQIFRGIFYLHKNHICHRDLKSENVLLAFSEPIERNVLKVSDFGLSCVFTPGTVLKGRMGTLTHMAPEILTTGKYTKAVDLWSCGVIMYQLLSGYLPFSGKEEEVKKGKFSFGTAEWWDISAEAVNLITLLLTKSPRSRCTIEKALRHKWIQTTTPKAPPVPLRGTLIDQLKGFRSLNKLHRASLNIVASMLGEDEISDSRAIFISMDIDGDGTLSVAELRERLAAAGEQDFTDVQGPYSTEIDEKVAQDFTYTEFLAATFNRKRCLTENVCKAAFACFDKNGDGSLSMSELAGGKLLGHLSLEELAQTLEDIDGNGDSYIDFAEFKQMLLS